jgi:cytochrome c553
MTRVVLTSLGVLAWFGALGVAYAAGDAQAGKAKTPACAMCHGQDGAGKGPNPPLAGESEEQIVTALGDYKSGKRVNTIMKPMASMLSDQDMSNLGAYYASLKR